MDGRRINRRERKYNPLFVLFLCLIAAVIVLLIVAMAMGVKLGKANKSLKAAETQVHELEKSVAQLESDLEAARHAGADAEPAAEPSAEPTETTPAAQQQEQQPAQQQQQQSQQQTQQEQQQTSGSWLDLSGHNEIKYKPTSLLDKYQTYYTNDGVNLRSGPATSYSRVSMVNKGTKVQVAARENGWSFVKVDGKFGWINSDYLSKTTPAPSGGGTRAEATSGNLKTN